MVKGTSRLSTLHWGWIALLSVFPFLGWWTYGLFDLDEGFYGAITAEMNRRHEWLTPYFNGHPWFEKPILLYWCAKPCLALFGDMVGPRLPSVVATLATIALVAWFGNKHFGPLAGRVSTLIMAGSLLPVATGRMMLVDPLLVFFVTAAMILLWESIEGNGKALAVSGLCVGFAVLAKGPVAIALFVLIAGWTAWREPALRPAMKRGWVGFLLLMLLAIGCWYVPAYLANPNLFVDQFLIEQNLHRFTGGDAAHNAGLVTLPLYVIVLLAGMLPASVWFWAAWPRRSGSTDVQRYLAVWVGVVFVFFTVAGSKMVHYVLPCCPPLALLVGDFLANRRERPVTLAICIPPIVVGLMAQFGFATYYGMFHREVHAIARYVATQPEQNVAVYQMPRREASLGTLRPKIQETSHPSLVMYLNRTVLEAEHLEDLERAPKPLWVITRMGRISNADVDHLIADGFVLREKEVDGRNLYRLYLLENRSAFTQGTATKPAQPTEPPR